MGKFKSISSGNKRKHIYGVRYTTEEHASIAIQAKASGLTVSDYIRAVTLQGRVDFHVETLLILEIRESVVAIRDLHASYLAKGVVPPEKLLGTVIQTAVRVIMQLGKEE